MWRGPASDAAHRFGLSAVVASCLSLMSQSLSGIGHTPAARLRPIGRFPAFGSAGTIGLVLPQDPKESIARRRREIDALEAAWLADVAEFDRSGDWRIDNHLNAAAAIRVACRMDHGVAAAHVALARKLEQLPDTAAALAAGEISRRHAEVGNSGWWRRLRAAISSRRAPSNTSRATAT